MAERTSSTVGVNEVLVVWKPDWIPITNVPDGPVLRQHRDARKCIFKSSVGKIILPVEPDSTLEDDMDAVAKRLDGDPASDAAQICSNCKCQPVAQEVKCGFTDWCKRCDLSLYSTRQYQDKCDELRFPYPPTNPAVHNDDVCPCGYFAIRNRPLARPGTNLLPMHLLVTIPITANAHITVCLICDALFKHHRNAVVHMRRHHKHYHDHH